MNLRRWLTPGIGVKRWLLVVFLGLLLLALGVAHLLRQLSRDLEPGGIAGTLLDVATLQFLTYPLRGLIVGSVGVALIALGAYRVMRVLTDPLRAARRRPAARRGHLPEAVPRPRPADRGDRRRDRAVGACCAGLKEHTSNLTAVVTVADDGGSSGVLRTELGIPAVGDIRNCIAALADAEPLMNELLQYRFPTTDARRVIRRGTGARRTRRRQPAARGDDRDRGR